MKFSLKSYDNLGVGTFLLRKNDFYLSGRTTRGGTCLLSVRTTPPIKFRNQTWREGWTFKLLFKSRINGIEEAKIHIGPTYSTGTICLKNLISLVRRIRIHFMQI